MSSVNTDLSGKDWLEMTFALSVLGLVLSFVIVTLEFSLFDKWQHLSFWTFVALKYLIIFVVIDLIMVCSNLVYLILITRLSVNHSLGLLADFVKSENYTSISFFLSVLSVQLNIFKTLSEYLGPRAALGALLGKFHHPSQQDLAFIFIDLQSSTQIAEKLGHVKYSLLIKRCFEILTESIEKYGGSIYRFVGDEAVLFWETADARRDLAPISVYFEFIENLKRRQGLFIEDFGLMPHFRAAIHSGIVTVTEIKSSKKEIVYHGDILNTCARIKDICSKSDTDLLCSSQIAGWISDSKLFKTELLGTRLFRGKLEYTEVFEIRNNFPALTIRKI